MTQDRFDNIIFIVILLKFHSKEALQELNSGYRKNNHRLCSVRKSFKKSISNMHKSLPPSPPVDSEKHSLDRMLKSITGGGYHVVMLFQIERPK